MCDQGHLAVAALSMVLICAACDKERKERSAPVPPEQQAVGTAVKRASVSVRTGVDGAKAEAMAHAERATGLSLTLGEAPIPNSTARRGAWSAEGGVLTLELDNQKLSLPTSGFPECNETTEDTDGDVWWRLDGEDGEIALRVAVDSVELRAYDARRGCVRTLPITAWLLGQADDVADPVFAEAPHQFTEEQIRFRVELGSEDPDTEQVANSREIEVSIDANRTELRRLGEVWSVTDHPSAVDRWTSIVDLAQVDGASFVRQRISAELEFGENVEGIADAIVIRRADGDDAAPLFVFRQSSAMWGAENADEQTTVERRYRLPSGQKVRVSSQRREYDGVRMVGVGKCPQTEGLVEIVWADRSTSWEIASDNGSRFKLGVPTDRTLEIRGCEDETPVSVGKSPALKSSHRALRSVVNSIR